MHLLLLGRGKTGSLVREVALQRRHHVRVMGASDNPDGSGLTPEALQGVDVVIDFTTPRSVLANIEACAKARKNMVVGTTGWYGEMDRVGQIVAAHKIGFLYAANFSIGVNLFFDAARAAAAALARSYSGQIFERHYADKKDAPSGTAIALQNIIREVSGAKLEITSFREGDVVGMHEILLNSENDRIYLCHDAASRRGFAEGAVLAAEWVVGKTGFFDFRDVWRDL
jgi:4-hydroxy-tetrahydrodipicolinate reductase